MALVESCGLDVCTARGGALGVPSGLSAAVRAHSFSKTVGRGDRTELMVI